VPHPGRVLLEQAGIAGHHLAMGIVDDLLAHPGLYLGVDHVVNADRAGAARIVITPLPGQAGVTLDYEIFSPSTPGRLLGHLERTIIGRSHQGPPVMVISDMHAASLAILRETGPGVFEPGSEVAAYPDEGCDLDAGGRSSPSLMVVWCARRGSCRAGRRGRLPPALTGQRLRPVIVYVARMPAAVTGRDTRISLGLGERRASAAGPGTSNS
jgi:hypothetical protein